MKTILINIIIFTIFSFSLKGQDTLFFWGNKLSDKTKFNRYEIKRQNENTLTKEFYSTKGGKWFKSEFSDSIVVITNSLIHHYYRFNEKSFDSTIIKVCKLDEGYLVNEFYDNGILKFSATSKKAFPFEFIGKASKYYRTGNLYANYFYSNNIIDSIILAHKDTVFTNYAYSHRIMPSSNLNNFTSLLMQNINYIKPSESSIISNYIFSICIENGKIKKYNIIRYTEFEFDNELFKAIEKVKKIYTFDKEESGCLIIPLHIDII